jgi:hypothetical protein
VVLAAVAVTPGWPGGRFTTVMQWDSYPPRDFGGMRFGMKSESFLPYLNLPARAGETLELAIGSASAPIELLRQHGWETLDPRGPTRDLPSYEAYIRHSKAEFGIAKHGYVVSRSGWFSERSLAYMAMGRPVLAQDTGFSDWLPCGEGLFAFRTPDEAIAAIHEINRRYGFHCHAARELVASHFDARAVLSALIQQSLNAPPLDLEPVSTGASYQLPASTAS